MVLTSGWFTHRRLSHSSPLLKRLAGFVLCWVWLLPFTGSADATSNREPRLALIVGHNQGNAGLKDLRYAQQDARRIRQVLMELGGYKRSEIILLEAPTAKKLKQIMRKLKRKLQSANKKGRFFFYFSGHSRPHQFQLGRDAVRFATVMRFVRSLPVRLRVVVVDSCYSGGIIRAKGEQTPRDKGAARDDSQKWSAGRFQESVARVKGTIILTSSSSRGRSYESDSIQSSLFTSSFIAGLRGAADFNQDQRVSLNEILDYVYPQTLAISLKSKLRELQTPVKKVDVEGPGLLFLTYLKKADAQMVFEQDIRGHLFLYRGDTLVHEFSKGQGKRIRVGVKAGRYVVHVRRKGRMGVIRTKLRSRQTKRIASAKLTWQQPSIREQVQKGSDNYPFTLSLQGHYAPISQLAVHGAALSLQFDVRRWMRVGLRYQFSFANAQDLPYRLHDLGFPLAFGYGLGFASFMSWWGLLVEPRLSVRTNTNSPDTFLNIGTIVGATTSFDYMVSPDFAMRISISGGVHLVFFDRDTRVSPAFDVGFGFSWRGG